MTTRKLNSNRFTTIKVTLPADLKLDIDKPKLLAVIGKQLVADTRTAMRSGRSRTGETLPAPKPKRSHAPAGRPLNDTGALIASLRWDKKFSALIPSTWPRREVGPTARSNYGLLRILLKLRYDDGDEMDPLGSQDPKLPERVNALAQTALDNLSAQGKLTLKAQRTKKVKIQ